MSINRNSLQSLSLLSTTIVCATVLTDGKDAAVQA